MSFSQYQQYYLQMMGVDVYLNKTPEQSSSAQSEQQAQSLQSPQSPQVPADNTEQPRAAKVVDKQVIDQPKQPAPQYQIALETFKGNALVADIYQLLKLNLGDTKSLGEACFSFGDYQWQITSEQVEPSIKGATLTTGPLTTLVDTKVKKQLWYCLSTIMDKAES